MTQPEPISQKKIVLVVGGGVTGQRAALDLAAADIDVILLERSVSLGGTVAQLGAMFPLHNCLLCRGTARHGPGCTRPTISPQLLDFSRPQNLTVFTQSELIALEGEAGSFRATIRRHPRYVDARLCINCDRCARVCPQVLPDEHQAGLSQRKAAYRPSFRAVPDAYAIDKGGYCLSCGLCQEICPTRAIDLVQQPFTETVDVAAVVVATGMQVYDATASQEYGYGRYANVFTGLEMERMISPAGPGEGRILRRSDGQVPQRIAWLQCVGSRDEKHDYCSTFCCGYATRQAVSARQLLPQIEAAIYLMDDRVFAKGFGETYDPLRAAYDIHLSRNRLSVLGEDSETRDLILQVTNETGKMVEERYGMIVLSIGAEAARGTKLLADVLRLETDAQGFLRTGSLSPVDSSRPGIYVAGAATGPADIADSVVQGSAAAAQARRFLGFPHRQANEPEVLSWPPQADERRVGVFACDCGGEIGATLDLAGVMAYARSLPGVVVAEVIPFGCLPSGLHAMHDLIATHALDEVVVGACVRRTYGPLFERDLPPPVRFVSLREECAYVHADDPAGATRLAKEILRVGAARAYGEVPLEPPVVEPVRAALVVGGGLAGMTAALHLADGGIAVHLLEREAELGGNALRLGTNLEGTDLNAHARGLAERVHSHPQIDVRTSAELWRHGGHQGNYSAVLRGADGALSSLPVGATIVATGAEEYRGPAYGLGQGDGVCTLLDLGQRLIDEPDLPGRLRQVVLISCVGPWDERDARWSWRCSRTCCEGILKHARTIKEANPACQVVVLAREVNAYAFREEHYTAARRAGVLFVRFDQQGKPTVEHTTGGMCVRVADTSLHEVLELRPDLVVLGTAILPRGDAAVMGARLGIPLQGEGFYQEWESKTQPFASLEPGVYLCGLAQGPRPSRETIAQALAAADHALSLLLQDKIILHGTVAEVDKRRCMACLTCVRVCPYSVPRMLAAEPMQGHVKAASYIDPARCQGCGICAADCPGKAITLHHYREEDLIGQNLLGRWLAT